MKKKILSFVLAVLMLGTPAAFAEGTEESPEETLVPVAEAIIMQASADEQNYAEENAAENQAIENTSDAEPDDLTSEETSEAEEISPEIAEEHVQEITSEDIMESSDESESNNEIISIVEASTPVAASESKSQKTIVIKSAELKPMPSNNDYCCLSFTFNCEEDGTVYEGYLAGITVSENINGKYTKITSIVSEESKTKMLKLVTDIADSFYAGESIKLSDSSTFSDKYGLIFNPIDTEKVHPAGGGTYTNTDDNLCWAASASDMIEFAGWDKAIDSQEGLTDQNKLLDYYEKSFTDQGASADLGIKWIMNGTFPWQDCDADGNVIYGKNASYSQEKLDGTTKDGGLMKDYAAETVVDSYTVKDQGYDGLYNAAEGLKDGQAAGIGIYFYKDGKRNGGHAITLLGYLKNTIKEGWESLSALFIADSDNNKRTAGEAEISRDQTIDSVTMYELNRGQINNNGTVINTLELANYSSNSTVPILDYCTLKPYSDSVTKEENGKKDAVKYVDYTVSAVEADNENSVSINSATVGDQVYLWCKVNNSSYQKLDLTYKPTIVVTYTVKCNGEVVATIKSESYLTTTGNTPQYPNTSSWVHSDSPITLTKSGVYTVSAHIDGIYDVEDGTRYSFNESYTSNNSSKSDYSFTVKDKEVTPSPYVPDDVKNKDNNTAKEQNKTKGKKMTKSVPTYSEIVMSTDTGDFEVLLKDLKKDVASINLDGVQLSADEYTLEYTEDGTVKVVFSNEFIQSLIPGEYSFRLYSASRNLIAFIELTVH